MRDLERILEINQGHYKTYGEEMPVLEEFVLGYRWMMAADTRERMSLALRAAPERPCGECIALLSSLRGKTAVQCLETLLSMGDPKVRTIAVSLANLLSKPFNTPERLADRGITRREGLNFPYQTEGKKVGIIGYGLYNNFFLGKCAEFHAFDFRCPRGTIWPT